MFSLAPNSVGFAPAPLLPVSPWGWAYAVPLGYMGQLASPGVMSHPVATAPVPDTRPGPVHDIAASLAALSVPAYAPSAGGALPAAIAAAPVAAPAPATARAEVLGKPAPAAVSTAKRKGSEVWAGQRNPRTVHATQVNSKFNPDAPAGNRDCGPVSVLIALRMLGIKAVGSKADTQNQVDAIRRAGTGSLNRTAGTTNVELSRALGDAGATTEETRSFADIVAAVKAGKPVVLHGNPEHEKAYGRRLTDRQALDYNGDHWITVTGFDEKSGKFIINDPLVRVGAIKVTRAELEAYRDGSLGIIVSR